MKKLVGIMLTLLLTNIIPLAVYIKPVNGTWTGTVYIKVDGSIDPPEAPIQRDGAIYTLTDDIKGSIVIERYNAILDGAGYTLQGNGSGVGITLSTTNLVTIRRANIQNFDVGIYLVHSFNIEIYGNNITNNFFGVILLVSNENNISVNNITNNYYGIWVETALCNYITGNNIADNINYGIRLYNSGYNEVTENNIIHNGPCGILFECHSDTNCIRQNIISYNEYYGICIYESHSNSIICNNITGNYEIGLGFYGASNNIVYHNNFNNSCQVESVDSLNHFNKGYPFGGNYWIDYNGTDLHSGPYQNRTGSDGIGDTPYVVNENNTDNYPLMNPWVTLHNIALWDVSPSKSVVGEGYSLNIYIVVANEGDYYYKTSNITLYADTTVIETKKIALQSCASVALIFTWNTTGYDKGSYTLWAYAWPVQSEANINDNTFIDGLVKIVTPGNVNGDTVVDMTDIGIILRAYGTIPTHIKWNPNADINNDGIVDMTDVGIALRNYAKTEP